MTQSEVVHDDSRQVNPDAILIDLFSAFSRIDNNLEAQMFLIDLLSPRELSYLARRLRIAILLAYGYSYSIIMASTGASSQTIASVSRWLEFRGEGYQLVIKKLGDIGHVSRIIMDTAEPDILPSEGISKNRSKPNAPYSECYWPTEVINAISHGITSAKRKA